MRFLHWLRGLLSPRRRAEWIYRRAMLHAKMHRHQAALDDYTAVLAMREAASQVRAMAYYNRALVYCALRNEQAAIDDLKAVQRISGAAEEVRTEARRKLVRMERTTDREAAS